jgi:hypothetical protein
MKTPLHRSSTILLKVACCAAMVLFETQLYAHPDGRQIGRSMRGCGDATTCHRMNAGATAMLAGPMMVAPNSRNTYTLSINSTLAGFVQGGCNVTATGATLSVNPMQPGTRLNGVEFVHSMGIPRAASGPVTIRFDAVAPGSGAFTLHAAGNATNGTTSSGDAWALASLNVQVIGVAPTDAAVATDVAIATDVAVVTDVVIATDGVAGNDSGLLTYDTSLSHGYGGCSTSPVRSHEKAPWAVIGMLATVVLRRRVRR